MSNIKRNEKELYKKIKNINSFDEFEKTLNQLDKKIKGDYFEIFFKIFFIIVPSYKNLYKHVYLYKEIPEKIIEETKLPKKDKGIDGIAITTNNEYYAIQCKYNKKRKIIPYQKLSSFIALSFGTYCEHIKKGIFFTNCLDVCKELKCPNKYINITYSCFEKCDKEFWDNFRLYLKNKTTNNIIPYNPLPHQKKILTTIKTYFNENKYGRLYMPCGTGKSLMGVFTSINSLNLSKIFIVVPSLYLLSETYETWLWQLYEKNKFKFLLIGSDIDKEEKIINEYILTTNEKEITEFLNNNKKNIIVITTYHSSEILKNVCKKNKFKFDMGIYDEAHRTVGSTEKKFTALLTYKNLSKKRLFMTATEKIYHYKKNTLSEKDQELILSMDDERIYGNIIHNYSIKEAINDKQLVDYKIISPCVLSEKYNKLLENNNYINIKDKIWEIRLVLYAFIILNLFKEGIITHLLIFFNRNERAKKIIEFIKNILEKDNIKIFTKYLSGNDNMNKRKYNVKLFEKAKRGIISSSRILGEGANIPSCDSVFFGDNKQSTNDIIQNMGRCLRIYNKNPNKIAHIIVPFLLNTEKEDFFSDDKQFKKIRMILKSIAVTDEMVSEKFILKGCNNILSYKKDNTIDLIPQIENGEKIDLDKFKQQIICKIFDKNGNSDDRIRKKLIYENNKRFSNNQKLIETKKKCIKFLQEQNETIIQEPKNWIKYCVGNEIFAKLKEKYCYDKNELINICIKYDILNFDIYKKKYGQYDKLPPPDYINDGFYYDMDPDFNLTMLIQKQISSDRLDLL